MKRAWYLLKRIFLEAMHDQLAGEAAKAAYYFFLSFFPAILALFALTGILGGDRAFEWIMERLALALPGQAEVYLAQFVQEVTGDSRPGVLSLSVLLTLWASSNVFVALTQGLNVMYDLEETRRWWLRRVIALGALLAAMILLTGGAMALLAGPTITGWLHLGPLWDVVRWPLAYLLLLLMMWLLYYLLPARDQRASWLWTLVGSFVGSGLWLLATFLFRLYVTNFGRFGNTYGFVGGIMVLLIWLYLTALAILFGGEVASTLEQELRRAKEPQP